MAPDRRFLVRVRALVEARLAGHRADVLLFGSRARNEARRTSDIDVAILPKDDIPPDLRSRLRDDLEGSAIPYPVEVVDIRQVSEEFRARVLREGVRWNV